MTLPDVPPSVCYPSGRHWQRLVRSLGDNVASISGSIIASGAAGGRDTADNLSCSMPTAIGRSTCANDRPKQPRPARGVREGLSCMTGNCHVQF